MTSNRRFYSAKQVTESTSHVLDGSEHQHLSKVLRAQPGDHVILFDGSGCEFDATIAAVRRNETELCVVSKRTVDCELPFELTLAVALPKGDRQQWLVEKAVELGVTKMLPLKTEFGVAQPGEKARQRMTRWIVAASKQSGRNRLMQVGDPTTPKQLFAATTSLLVAHPKNSKRLHLQLGERIPTAPQTIAIGPEGGFSDGEIELATENQCKIVSLGPRILRIETAAVALVSALIYAFDHE